MGTSGGFGVDAVAVVNGEKVRDVEK